MGPLLEIVKKDYGGEDRFNQEPEKPAADEEAGPEPSQVEEPAEAKDGPPKGMSALLGSGCPEQATIGDMTWPAAARVG